ncbi:hypothetical protein GYA13_04945 [Candidatus Kuenenbacteria bacterium]|nr:hypothetical protein [Candidatus Kuenenbacteria bacterium]
MSLKKYLFLMVFATVLCWTAWAFVLFFINPETAGTTGMIFFYGSLFLGLFGLFSILGFVIRHVIGKRIVAYQQAKTAFRQGAMFALLLTGSLFLQGQRLLVWWNTLLFIFLLSVIEYFFLTSEEKKNNFSRDGE